jgi:hypothetical protein
MAIEVEQDESSGEMLYEVLREWVAKLKSTEQLTLGFAFQKGTPWGHLSAEQRRAFCSAAEDLKL